MIEFVVGLLQGFVGFLLSVLPNSPFQSLTLDASGFVGTGLGYLNWVFPIADCMALMGAWLALLAIVYLAQFAMSKISGVISLAGGGS